MLNIYVEGVPGSGKSTLLGELQKNVPEYKYYYEGDICPVELAWCSYMTQEQYNKAIEDWPQFESMIKENSKMEGSYYIVSYTKIQTDNHEFYRYMEQYEIYGGRKNIQEFEEIIFYRFHSFYETGNVFECAFFQNIIDELMLFAEYDDNQILDFYRMLITQITDDFLVIRLISNDIKSSIEQIKKERINEQGEEVWYHLMMDYLSKSPYGKYRNYQGFDDMVRYFERRITLEKRIASEILQNKCINIESKNYQLGDILKFLK
ncbi:P-loop NTPase family protein [Anaeromicropila herbilytica]|uniref:Deoxynucleoside kinase domain-containing protein n=1 Tax=Anaeromicropila herbilytica TaxID=2785025 RepID=A0A7R7EI07_9FIRM|nr:hypothetical protein [Anaeromicropila herbilytica]BCN29094.1 hypothetical protein bsdtb5_03890 [Anaeromicropila herbilytica]